jgi:uncharacterized membrane protein
VRSLSLRKVALADAAVAILLFALAGVFAGEEDGVKSVLGAIGWFGFWLCLLVMVALSVVTLVRLLRRASTL